MILKNALVLKSFDSEIEKFDVEIENGRITRVEKEIEGDGIDLSGKAIMPAFYNTHTHAAMTLMRGISDDDDFKTWLFKKVLPVEERLSGEMVYYGTMVAMMEMASKGIAGFIDMYFFLDDVARAVSEFGMRALITRGLVDEDGNDGGRLQENLDVYERWNKKGLIEIGLGPHAPYTCSRGYLERIAKVAEEMNIKVTIHLREARWERDAYDLKEILKIFEGVDLIAVHVVHVDDDDIEIMKDLNVKISHNPTSNLKLGNGISPISKFMEKGITVGLGTDGCASNNSLDVWHEMRTATLLQKLEDPKKLDVNTALKMATLNGASIFGIDGGKIEVGKVADLVVIDIEKPHYHPTDKLKSHIVHSGSSGDVFATMVNGRWVYFDGEFPTIDSERMLEEFERLSKKLLNW